MRQLPEVLPPLAEVPLDIICSHLAKLPDGLDAQLLEGPASHLAHAP